MTLALIGLGLGNQKDITLRGLELVKAADIVYLEGYTSLLQCPISTLEELYGKKIMHSDRAIIENGSENILAQAKTKHVAVLIVGDVFSATTHWDFYQHAKELGISVDIVHNASILTAVGDTGLQLYKFGRVTSIPFPQDRWVVETPYTVLKENESLGLHTLFLLDLDPHKNTFLSIPDAIRALLHLEEQRKERLVDDTTLFIGCARLGSRDAVIKTGTASELLTFDFGKAPYCLIIPGKMHFIEEEAIKLWK